MNDAPLEEFCFTFLINGLDEEDGPELNDAPLEEFCFTFLINSLMRRTDQN